MNRDVVILAGLDWNAAWQRHHAFAAYWANTDSRVFFVENTGIRTPKLSDIKRVISRLNRISGAPARNHGHPPGIDIIGPAVLPPTNAGFRTLNRVLFVSKIAAAMRARGLRPGPIVFAYLPTETTLQLLDQLAPSITIYDCVDNFLDLPDRPHDLAETEKALLSRSAIVLATSPDIYKRLEALHPNVRMLHHGVASDFFLPPRAPGPHRRLVYFGTVRSDIDFAAIRALANAGYEVDLIGPVKWAPKNLGKVHLRGAVPRKRLPEALRNADALLLPYKENDFTRGIVPAKIYECLATSRPVLSSPLPGLLESPEFSVLRFARTPADWVAAARSLDLEDSPDRGRARVAVAQAHSEEAACAVLKAEVDKVLDADHDGPRGPETSCSRTVQKGAPPPKFLSGLGWIGALFGAAKAATLLTQVAAGRWLGPEEYGRANLVLAAAAYLQIAPMLGFPTAIGKFLAAESGEKARARFTSTALALFALWMLACVPALALAREPLERALGLPAELFLPALLLAVANSAYVVAASPLLGLKRFAQRGFTEIIYGASVPLALLAAGLALGHVYQSLIAALTAAFLIGTAHALWSQRRYLTTVFEKKVLGDISRYAAVATLNLLAAACVLAPARLALNARGGVQSVGVFSAYFTATVQMALAFLYMIQSVIVPMAADPRGQREVWDLFRRRAPAALAGAWAVFIVALLAALAVFGRRYPLRWDWVMAFPLAAVLALAHGMLSSLFAARDFSGLRVSVTGGLIAGLGNAALATWLVPDWGVSGAVAALLASYALGLAFFAAVRVAENRPSTAAVRA